MMLKHSILRCRQQSGVKVMRITVGKVLFLDALFPLDHGVSLLTVMVPRESSVK
jgi:hypothetical protein